MTNSDYDATKWICACIAAIVITFICCAFMNEYATAKFQLEKDKVALSNGLCQVLNGSSTTWPNYHYEACRK